MSSTDDPYEIGTATFTGRDSTRPRCARQQVSDQKLRDEKDCTYRSSGLTQSNLKTRDEFHSFTSTSMFTHFNFGDAKRPVSTRVRNPSLFSDHEPRRVSVLRRWIYELRKGWKKLAWQRTFQLAVAAIPDNWQIFSIATTSQTGITLGTFIKDLVELVQDIKNSIEKVGENKERLSKLRDGVVSTLNGLTKLTEAHEYKEPSPELLSALENLKSYLRHIQDKCQRQASRQRTSKVSGVDTFKSWWKRNEIEAEIKRLDEYKNECYTQFTLFSTARTEGKTVQIA
ncbi:hypothetical protein B0H13DRAFT_2286687, partial [Mycena leptocephala]